jgi:hypothetical protein
MAVDFRNWVADVRTAMGKGRLFGLLFGLYYVFVGLWLTVSSRIRFGTPVYDQEWDLLVVLDTCRVDALDAVAEEYDFLGDRDAVWSVGSTSSEWVTHTFDREYADEVARTAYVTANPHSELILHERDLPPAYTGVPFTWPAWDPVDAADFLELEEVWRYGTDDRLGVVPPATMTDRAITLGRELEPGRLVVHYMQPHAPYIAGAVAADGPLDPAMKKPLEALQAGRVDEETVWAAYLDNLRLVLDELERLLENVDAEDVVITADHGEAFGEYGFYEHPIGCPHPVVKQVPWARTTAVDRGTSRPQAYDREATDSVVEKRLEDLGYA